MKHNSHRTWLKAYYDKNTIFFNKFGKAGRTHNIHASIWHEGIADPFSASHYSNQLILETIISTRKDNATILDLGCGIGGSLIYLSERLNSNFTLAGITLSSYQAQNALSHIRSEIASRIAIQQGDFHELPEFWQTHFDVVYAIESFVHSDDPTHFIKEASRVLRPGGLLLLIDTFPQSHKSSQKVDGYIKDYQTQWGAGNTLTPEELFKIASEYGLQPAHNEDLTKYIATNRRRDYWIGLLNKLFRPLLRSHIYLQSLRGGHAVQMGFRQGWLSYRFLKFIKVEG